MHRNEKVVHCHMMPGGLWDSYLRWPFSGPFQPPFTERRVFFMTEISTPSSTCIGAVRFLPPGTMLAFAIELNSH